MRQRFGKLEMALLIESQLQPLNKRSDTPFLEGRMKLNRRKQFSARTVLGHQIMHSHVRFNKWSVGVAFRGWKTWTTSGLRTWRGQKQSHLCRIMVQPLTVAQTAFMLHTFRVRVLASYYDSGLQGRGRFIKACWDLLES